MVSHYAARQIGMWLLIGCLGLPSFGEERSDGGTPVIPRVALMGSDLADSGEAALGLAEVSLSGRDSLILLDRTAIGAVLREHGLLAGGFARTDDAIHLGELLSVDLFVHVEGLPDCSTLSVIAFETVHGMRLLDDVLVGSDAHSLAETLAAAVEKALKKWTAPTGQFVSIALMGVRNVDLPKSRNSTCEALGSLVERRLVNSPSVVVVERKRLQSLNVDREVAVERPSERLLAAPILLELDVSQAGKEERLLSTAHLMDANGSVLGSVQAEGVSLTGLADELSAKILHMLKSGDAPPSSSPGIEAARFFRQARFWKAQGRSDLMLSCAEAAYALDSENADTELLLINSLFTAASTTLTEARPEALAHAARGMAMLREYRGTTERTDKNQQKQVTMLTADLDNFFRGFGLAVGTSRDKKPFTEEEAADYATFCRNWLVYSPFAPDSERAPSSWDLVLFLSGKNYINYFPDVETAWRLLAQQVPRWCKERRATDPQHLMASMFSKIIRAGDPTAASAPADYPMRALLWIFLEEQESPILSFYGRCGRVVDVVRLASNESQTATVKSRDLLADIQAELKVTDHSEGFLRDQLYDVALLTIKRYGSYIQRMSEETRAQMRQQLPEMMELFQTMLAVGDVHEPVLVATRNLLNDAERAGLVEPWRESLSRLNAALAETIKNPSPEMTSDQLKRLTTFHVWVCEELDPGSSALPPVDNATLSPIELIKLDGRFLGHAAVLGDGDGVYVISAFRNPNRLLLQKWTPGSAAPIALGTVEPHGPMHTPVKYKFQNFTIPHRMAGITDACIGKSQVVVAVAGEGVFLFDRSVASAKALPASLPVTQPLSVGILGQLLFVGTDDGYLVSFDLETGTSDLLVASTRKEKRSPFDDAPPVKISAIFPDPDRDRIVFVASVVGAESQLGMALSELGGIWEYRAGSFKQLITYPHRNDGPWWCEMVDDHSFAMRIMDFQQRTLQFNMNSDSLKVLNIGSQGAMGRVAQKRFDSMLPSGATPTEGRYAIAPPFLMRGDDLWTAHPWGRLSTKTYAWENLPPFRMPDGSIQSVLPNLGMIPIGDNQIILADMDHLWLMTTKEEPVMKAPMNP